MSRPVLWRMVITVLAGFLRIAASMCFVWASKHLVDIATGVKNEPLGTAIALFGAILLIQILTLVFLNWWDGYNLVKTQNILRKELFGKVLRSRWDGKERFLSGDTVNRLEEDIRVVAELISERLPGLAITLVQLLAASVYLLYLAPNLLWVILILMGSAVVFSRLFFMRLRKIMASIRARESEIQQVMQESLQHRVLVLTLTSIERVLDKFGWLQADVEDNTRKRLNYNAVSRGLMFLGFQVGHAAAFLWGIFGIIHGTVTYGMMTAFLQLVGQVQRPIAELGRQIPAFIQVLTSVERLMDLGELEQEPLEKSVRLPGAPEIVADKLTYSYPGQEVPVFDGFSCNIPGGSFCVIAGPTGSGKSTLLRLILGLLKPTSGTITIGGGKAGSSLRENFMYVPQGNTLLSGTIRSNLQLASPLSTEEDMWKALDISMAQFVKKLPKGLDTECGETGGGLSEGQCQRIAIARALLRSGGVMILDESTSALDEGTEKQLLKNIFDTFHGRKTVLLVSHRPAAMEFADCLVQLS